MEIADFENFIRERLFNYEPFTLIQTNNNPKR